MCIPEAVFKGGGEAMQLHVLRAIFSGIFGTALQELLEREAEHVHEP